jgi:hypothetical protein
MLLENIVSCKSPRHGYSWTCEDLGVLFIIRTHISPLLDAWTCEDLGVLFVEQIFHDLLMPARITMATHDHHVNNIRRPGPAIITTCYMKAYFASFPGFLTISSGLFSEKNNPLSLQYPAAVSPQTISICHSSSLYRKVLRRPSSAHHPAKYRSSRPSLPEIFKKKEYYLLLRFWYLLSRSSRPSLPEIFKKKEYYSLYFKILIIFNIITY